MPYHPHKTIVTETPVISKTTDADEVDYYDGAGRDGDDDDGDKQPNSLIEESHQSTTIATMTEAPAKVTTSETDDVEYYDDEDDNNAKNEDSMIKTTTTSVSPIVAITTSATDEVEYYDDNDNETNEKDQKGEHPSSNRSSNPDVKCEINIQLLHVIS